MKRIALLVLLTLAVPSLAEEPTHTRGSLDTVKKMLAEKKAVLVDVREMDEWDAGHIKEAISLPLSKLKAGVDGKELVKVLPKDCVIYVHCAVGGRSLSAAELLRKQGVEVRPLKPGYMDLLDSGFPREEK